MRMSDWSSDVCSSDLQFDTYESHSQTPFLGDPMDIASAVVFLASDNARFYTGQVMVVDGGYPAHFPHVAQNREAFEAKPKRRNEMGRASGMTRGGQYVSSSEVEV